MSIPTNHRQAERKLISLVMDGRWEIDDHGQVWRCAFKTGLKNGGSHIVASPRRRAEKVIPDSYLMVRAMIDGVRVCGLAHRLVWQHMRGDIPDGLIINHINGAKNDNRICNLELSNYSENARHALSVLGRRVLRGSETGNSRLSDADVAEILKLRAEGVLCSMIGAKFGISAKHVSRVANGGRWSHMVAKPVGRTRRNSGATLDSCAHDARPEVSR